MALLRNISGFERLGLHELVAQPQGDTLYTPDTYDTPVWDLPDTGGGYIYNPPTYTAPVPEPVFPVYPEVDPGYVDPGYVDPGYVDPGYVAPTGDTVYPVEPKIDIPIKLTDPPIFSGGADIPAITDRPTETNQDGTPILVKPGGITYSGGTLDPEKIRESVETALDPGAATPAGRDLVPVIIAGGLLLTIFKGESIFKKRQKLVFIGGLGALVWAMHRK